MTYRLQPDRDLQCYFQTNTSYSYMYAAHTGIAAITETSPTGLTLTGTFHDQYDWSVIEWNRDNQYEHIWMRNLPNGDFTGLTLSWRETRSDNCVQMDSGLYDWQDWSRLRIFVGKEIAPRKVLLSAHATSAGSGAWDISITFDGTLLDTTGTVIPVSDIRAIRWTYCSKMVSAVYTPLDYTVTWTYFAVTGSTPTYKYAGEYSTLIGCTDPQVTWSGYYVESRGNYVGGVITYFDHTTTTATIKYRCAKSHDLYIGSQWLDNTGKMKVVVDGTNTNVSGYDLFMTSGDIGWNRVCQIKVGSFAAGEHTVVVTSVGETTADKNTSSSGWRIFFSHLLAAVLVDEPVMTTTDHTDVTLATDWDTAHSLELNPQRVIWNLLTMGFKGRTNHYVGALKWYKLTPVDGSMASGWFQLAVSPDFATAKAWGEGVGLYIDGLRFDSYIHSDFTSLNDVANDFIAQINSSSTSVWAALDGTTAGKIIINARHRSGGSYEPNGMVLSVVTATHLQISTGGSLSGGVAYNWVVDKAAATPMNAATVAWIQSYLTTLKANGIDAVLALSQELAHEPKTSALAARYSDGSAVWLNTPALQTSLRPETQTFFKPAFLQLAQMMDAVGMQPFLQFGECQWWYFATVYDISRGINSATGDYTWDSSSMGVYDDYTTGEFATRYGGTMHVFVDDCDRTSNTSPTVYGTALGQSGAKTPAQVLAAHPNECALLSTLIGEYTSGIIDYVKATVPACKFEVLYPLDVNEGGVPNNINQPPSVHWGPGKLDAFKCEGFGYMFSRSIDKLKTLIRYPFTVRTFDRSQSRCLLGSYDPNDPIARAVLLAKSEGVSDKVLWAFDQFAMRSHPLPMYAGDRTFRLVTW